MLKRLLILFMIICMTSVVLGQSGKLSGVVKDKDTGDPLPGVNVVIKETLLGASTDVDGFFVILNVPPGTHSVTFDYIGYQQVEVGEVRVVSDLTKRLDVELAPTTIELDDAVIIVAEKPFFEVAATNTVRVLDSDEIARIPIKGVNSIVSVNAGVVVQDGSGGQTDNATLNVRGGRGNETLFIIDGVPYNDLLFGNAAGTIPDGAIEQVSSQIGGFSAKYGSAQSGVVNIVTKSGSSKFFGSVEGITSESLDDYGYNNVSATIGGPLMPGGKLTFFASGEYIDALDDDPSATLVDIAPTSGTFTGFDGTVSPYAFDQITHNFLPNNESEVTRVTGKLDAFLGSVRVTAATNNSFAKRRDYIHSYVKNNSQHNPRIEEDNLSGSLKVSQILNNTTFWDFTARVRDLSYEQGDGVFFNDLLAYGNPNRILEEDPTAFLQSTSYNQLVRRDFSGIFWGTGRVNDYYQKYNIQTLGGDLNFTKQLSEHLIELGGTYETSKVRHYEQTPSLIADNPANPREELVRYTSSDVRIYGYDVFGNEIDGDLDYEIPLGNGNVDPVSLTGPRTPTTISFYVQDKIEFQDFILNIGGRYDHFDAGTLRLKNPDNLLGDNATLDPSDWETAPAEQYVSPRFGFAFPVTEHTVFHAQYGVFRQQPQLFDLYDSWLRVDRLENDDQFSLRDGHLRMETTTQYEFGFKQQFGDQASLDLTAYYKNVKDLVNFTSIRTAFGTGGTFKRYLGPQNQDFGTIKGMAMSFTLRRIGPVSAKIDYTLALSEGTGSSTDGAFIAAFRNPNGEVPISIAPLDFDQRHTLTTNIDIRNGKGEGPVFGNFRPLENAGANFLVTFNSGRPYTPLEFVDLLAGTSNYGSTTQYINTGLGPSLFRIDMKVDKAIDLGPVELNPYLWIQNLLDTKNVVSVYQSTGEADNTAFLDTDEGREKAQNSGNPGAFISDYQALENDAENFGLPRVIRVGMKLKF